MIVAILWGRFAQQIYKHGPFLTGVVVGMGIMATIAFLIALSMGLAPFGLDFNYSEPPGTQELVLLPAPTDTEIIDTEMTGNQSSGFSFTGRFIANNDPVNDFQCSLDGGEYVGCSQTVKIEDMGTGEHTFEVRSVLGNGTVDPTPAVSLWSVE